MDYDISKLIKTATGIKLKGGIFTKVCVVIIIVSLCIFGIAIRANNQWMSIGSILLIFIFAIVILWRLINFANKNPQAAILEGAEFLIHEQIQLAAKGKPEISKKLSEMEEDKPIEITESAAQIPDENNSEGGKP
ncbi:MAG: hypothetical protein WC734_03175 [Patescibacteria group bacterium]|jgi:ABC-type nickel/cobalt efflux system permease component RcnA